MSRDEIIASIKAVMEKNRSFITEAYIFGSFAKNRENMFSDVDIAVSCEDYMKFCDIYDEIMNIPTIRDMDIHNICTEQLYFDLEEIRNSIKLL